MLLVQQHNPELLNLDEPELPLISPTPEATRET